MNSARNSWRIDPLTEEAFVRALIKLKKGKACGPDNIPGEVYCNCESAARELYELLSIIWEREYVPPELVRAAFVMIFKNKGSHNDPTKYRCIGLLPHAYKILSLVMLERIQEARMREISVRLAGRLSTRARMQGQYPAPPGAIRPGH